MTPAEIIQSAFDRLADEHDEDPRSELMRGLSGLLVDPDRIPTDDRIHLTATVQPGGAFSVRDQHGRTLDGVQSVAVFRDQSGRDVMQINL